MKTNRICDRIDYIAATESPLSADIGIVKTAEGIWLYDVGNDPDAVRSLTDKYNVVLSHFHPDHIGNLKRLNVEKLYVSNLTFKHTGCGTLVECELYVDDLHIFPLPSSHSKGCLGLEVGDYAFVGDAVYCRSDAEHYIYNAQLLKAEIDILKKLSAKYLLVSHFDGLIRDKAEVIRQLEAIYSLRDRNSHEILVKKSQ